MTETETLPEELAIPPAIPTAVVTTKIKEMEFDDFEEDMALKGYIEFIPTIKAGITATEFALKEVVLKNALVIRNCSEFYSESKHTSLSSREGGGTSDEEKDALKRHLLSISIPTLACQNNATIMSYVEESKDDTNWPSGQMHLIVAYLNELKMHNKFFY